MTIAQERRTLFESNGIAVVDFRCREHVAQQGREEPNGTNSIAFIRRGIFERSYEGRLLVADAAHVLFFNAGRPYRYAHPIEGGDDCTILTIESRRALEIVRRYSRRDGDRDDAPFALAHAMTSPTTARLHYELLRMLRHPATTLAIDDVLCDLAGQAVRDAYVMHDRRRDRQRMSAAAQVRARDLTEHAKREINRALSSPPTLERLSATVGCSPFYLSRTFHRTAGVTLRGYLRALRANTAADALSHGAPDLTELALDLGYVDHSHFTNAFRRAFGIAPSSFRARYGGRA